VKRLLLAVGLLLAACLFSANPSAAAPCGTAFRPVCGGAGSDPAAGDFQGLIALQGAPWVLNVAGHAGTQPGCGDCSWTIVLACASGSPADPGTPVACAGASNSGACKSGDLLYRLYLTTVAVTNALEGTICVGPGHSLIPISDRAKGDVQRYLRDVTPPDLDITTRPALATLAGLPTSFRAQPPTTLRPAPFGGPDVTETITIAPIKTDWRWGDGSTSGWTNAASSLTHAYYRGGIASVELRARWGATYTITFEGQTVGPYVALGQLTTLQTLTLPVHTSTPTLVSH
jgi:hypothetical protein